MPNESAQIAVGRPSRTRHYLELAKRWRYRLTYRRTLSHMLRHLPQVQKYQLTGAQRREITDYWRSHGIDWVNLTWYRIYGALTGHVDPTWVPEDTFRVEIEPYLCAESLAGAYADKNMLQQRLADMPQPRTLLRNIHGRYFTGDYELVSPAQARDMLAAENTDFMVKPSVGYTGGGCGVHLLRMRDGRGTLEGQTVTLADIERNYAVDFAIQHRMKQSESMARFHPDSLNTTRVITLRLDETIHVIASTFRMGNGKHVDNGHSGGLLCGVDIQTGRITGPALDVHFLKFDEHPMTKVRFEGQQIVSYEKMKQLCVGIHQRLDYFDQLSFDVALDTHDQPSIIEINTFGQGVEPHQCLKGAALHAPFAEQVLATVRQRREAGWIPR